MMSSKYNFDGLEQIIAGLEIELNILRAALSILEALSPDQRERIIRAAKETIREEKSLAK